MTTTNLAVDAIVRHIGFPERRVRAVATTLTAAGVLPSGGPGRSPQLDTHDVVSLIVGCAVEVPLRSVADAVGVYRALTPGGASLEGAPSSIDTAGRALDILADIAARGDADLYRRDMIEVVSNWPEIAVHSSGKTTRFVAPGALASNWQDAGHRRSTTINGAAFVDAVRELFAKE